MSRQEKTATPKQIELILSLYKEGKISDILFKDLHPLENLERNEAAFIISEVIRSENAEQTQPHIDVLFGTNLSHYSNPTKHLTDRSPNVQTIPNEHQKTDIDKSHASGVIFVNNSKSTGNKKQRNTNSKKTKPFTLNTGFVLKEKPQPQPEEISLGPNKNQLLTEQKDEHKPDTKEKDPSPSYKDNEKKKQSQKIKKLKQDAENKQNRRKTVDEDGQMRIYVVVFQRYQRTENGLERKGQLIFKDFTDKGKASKYLRKKKQSTCGWGDIKEFSTWEKYAQYRLEQSGRTRLN